MKINYENVMKNRESHKVLNCIIHTFNLGAIVMMDFCSNNSQKLC